MKLDGLKILLTGGSGRLGGELSKLLWAERATLSYPTSKQWDISSEEFPEVIKTWIPDLIIHCAAYTDVPGAETNREAAINVNVFGTKNVVTLAKTLGCRLVHISSDYVTYYPMGYYAVTKLMAEAFVPKTETIIRTSFKDRGSWGEHALKGVFHPVHTNADWTDVIAKKIINVLEADTRGIVNVGTEAKTLKDLASQEYPEVEEIPVEKADTLLGYHYPRDCTMEVAI